MPENISDGRQRLDYVDGLRGLTALYVVLFHCRSEFTWRHADGGLSLWLRLLTAWTNFGHYAVVVFIVLSGYCLMLPVVRSQDRRLAGGLWEYLKRRAHRTLPAYYGAIAFSLILTALIPGLQHQVGAQWDRCLPAFRPDVLLSHLLMLHNLRFEWHQTINAPLWSMATEWDIYLVFALLLLPIWRLSGTLVSAGMAMLLGLLPHLLLPGTANFDWACPWFVGCFALGMAGAVVGFSQEADETRWRTQMPWPRLAVILGASVLLICVICPDWGNTHWVNVDPMVAGAAACALIAATRRRMQQNSPSGVLRLLASRPLSRLGALSYSLYLIHFPLLALIHIPLRKWGLSPDAAYLCLLATAVPISMLTAFLFSQIFERAAPRGMDRPHRVQSGQETSANKKAA
jgi:peptidoglycan/LPS O-acetylase OafA/YrhL